MSPTLGRGEESTNPPRLWTPLALPATEHAPPPGPASPLCRRCPLLASCLAKAGWGGESPARLCAQEREGKFSPACGIPGGPSSAFGNWADLPEGLRPRTRDHWVSHPGPVPVKAAAREKTPRRSWRRGGGVRAGSSCPRPGHSTRPHDPGLHLPPQCLQSLRSWRVRTTRQSLNQKVCPCITGSCLPESWTLCGIKMNNARTSRLKGQGISYLTCKGLYGPLLVSRTRTRLSGHALAAEVFLRRPRQSSQDPLGALTHPPAGPTPAGPPTNLFFLPLPFGPVLLELLGFLLLGKAHGLLREIVIKGTKATIFFF